MSSDTVYSYLKMILALGCVAGACQLPAPVSANEAPRLNRARCENWKGVADFTGRDLDSDHLASHMMIARILTTAPLTVEVLQSEMALYPKRDRWPIPRTAEDLVKAEYLQPPVLPEVAEKLPEFRYDDLVVLRAYTQTDCLRIADNPPLIHDIQQAPGRHAHVRESFAIVRYGTPDDARLRIFAGGGAEYVVGDQAKDITLRNPLTAGEFSRLQELLASPEISGLTVPADDVSPSGSRTADYLVLSTERLFPTFIPPEGSVLEPLRSLLESIKKRLRRPLGVRLYYQRMRQTNIIPWPSADFELQELIELQRTAMAVLARAPGGEERTAAENEILARLGREIPYPLRLTLQSRKGAQTFVADGGKLYRVFPAYAPPADKMYGMGTYLRLTVQEITAAKNDSPWRLWPADAGIRLQDMPREGVALSTELLQRQYDFFDSIGGFSKFIEDGVEYERVNLERFTQ